MSRSIMQSTQVMIAFQVEGDREQDLISLLQIITQIALFLWGLWVKVNRLRREVKALQHDITEAATFTVKVMAIGLMALAYGMGAKV